MGKIVKVSSARHEPSPFIKDFTNTTLQLPWAKLPRHFATFPKEWPFPRGDLNHWIEVLNRFEEILELFVRQYELDSGPQTLPFLRKVLLHECAQNVGIDETLIDTLGYAEDGDCFLVQSILDFTALLFDNCSNRSLYRSSDRLGSILNTSSISLLHTNLRLCLRLAKRFHTTRTRQNNSSSQLPQLLKDQFDMNLEHLLKIALPFPRPQSLQSLGKAGNRGKDRRSSQANSNFHPSDLVGLLKLQQSDEILHSWATVEYSPRNSSADSTLDTHSSPNGATPEPASPSARRSTASATRDEPAEPTKTISINPERLQAPIWEVFAEFSDAIPADDQYDFLHRLRFAKALQEADTREELVSMRLLAVAILAFVHGDHIFQQKISSPIAEEPRAYQLPHQLSELLQPPETSGITVSTPLQTIVVVTLEALCMQKSINADVYSALSANVSHGVLFYVTRKAVSQLNDEEELDANSNPVINHIQEEWRNSLFELLRTIPHAAPRAAENLFAAGVLDILNNVLRIRTFKALRTQHKVVTFLDNFIHSVRESIGPYVSSNGLETIADLVAFIVDDACQRLARGQGLPESYRSRGAEYEIPFYHQSTIKVCLKLLSHMMMHQNGNFNRHIRVLFDSRTFVAALNKVLDRPTVFGSALWSGVLNFMSEFLNNEPTSYSIVAESQLNETFLKILHTKIELPPLNPSGSRSIERWVKQPQNSILAATDALTAIPAAISALCLNEAGIRQFQTAELFSNFLKVFESPAHLHIMESESMDIPVALGRAFDELIRHHPSLSGGLRKPITTAIVQMTEHVVARAEAEAEQYGFGAKLLISDAAQNSEGHQSPKLQVSGGREALRGYARSASNAGGDIDMTEERPVNGVTPIGEDIVEQNKASPTPMTMLFNTLRFLAAFCTNQTTRQTFMDAGGVKLVLDLITSPAIPAMYQIGDPIIVNSVSKLLQFLMEDRPWLVVPAILHRLDEALNILEPLYRNTSSRGFFDVFTRWDHVPKQLNSALDSTDIATEHSGTNYVKALLNIRTLTEGLAIVFQNQTYNHRSQASLFVIANYTDSYIATIARLGELQRSCAWQELQMLLDPTLPEEMLEGIRHHRGRVTSHLLFAEDILVDHGIDVPERSLAPALPTTTTTTAATNAATNSEAGAVNGTVAPLGTAEAPSGDLGTQNAERVDGIPSENFKGHATAQCKNITILRNIFQEIFISVGSLISSLNRILVARRGQDSYSRQNAQKVAAQIATSTIEQLQYSPPRNSDNPKKRLAYWVTILSNAYSLFIDENSTSPHTLTLFIQYFKTQGGFTVLEQLMDSLLATGEDSSNQAAGSDTTSNYTKGCISLLLDIFGPIVVAKHVTESPQSQALTTRGVERTRSDYFNSGQFLVELRLLAMQPIMKLWPAGKGDDAEIIRGQINILRPILEGEGENGAFSRADNIVVKSKAVAKKWAPRSSEALDLLSVEFGEDLAKEALFRCGDNTANARSYCQTFKSNDANGFLRNPIPVNELANASTQQATQTPLPPPPPPLPHGTAPNPAPGTASTQTDDDETRNEEGNAEDMDTSDSDDEEVDSDEGEAETETNAASQELAESIHPPTADDLEEKRAEIRSSLIDRCLDLLNRHDNLPFELRDLVTAACKSKSFLAHRDVGPTVLTSVVSLQPDDDLTVSEAQAHWKKIAAYSLFLALILQMKEFYEAAKEDLLEHLDVLLNLTRYNKALDSVTYGNATSHILLVLEFLFQDDMSPCKISWHPPLESDAIDVSPQTIQIEKPILTEEQRELIFDAILDVIPHVGENNKLAMAVTRTLVALTRQRSLAVRLSEKKNLQRLFSMIKQIGGHQDANMQHNVLLILRHIIEDNDVLRQIMKSEIQVMFDTRGRQHFETASYCRNLSHLALRSPQIFLEVSQELVKIAKYDPHHPSQMLALKKSKSDRSASDVQEQISTSTTADKVTSAASDPMEMSIANLDAPDSDRTKQAELKMPVNESSDGLIQFMLGELMNYKDVEDSEISTATKADPNDADHNTNGEVHDSPHGISGFSQLPPFSLVFNDDKPKMKGTFKPEHNRIFLYRCFLLQSLTELLSSYTKAKIDFVNFRRRADAAGSTPSRPRSLVLNYLLQSLIPTDTVAHAEDVASKKKEAISQWASHVINGLCAKTFEVLYTKDVSADSNPLFNLSSWEEEPELVYVRKYVLEQSIKAFREALCSAETTEIKYSRILKLADLFYRLLVQKAQTSPVPAAAHEMLQLSQKLLAKIMYEKGFIVTLTAAITEIDLTHPGAKRVVKYLLRPLKHLTELANDLSINSGSNGPAEINDQEEILSDSVDSELDEAREETPDLFRNSALGILAGDAASESESDDAMEEDEMYDEYMDEDYDEDMAYDDENEEMNHDPEEIVSDEDEDMTGIEDPVDQLQSMMGGVESSSGEDDDDEDEDSEENDEEDDSDEPSDEGDSDDDHDSLDEDIDVENVDMTGAGDDDWATESPDEEDEGEEAPQIREFGAVPPIIQQLQDLERGITHLNNLSMLESMSDQPGYDTPDFQDDGDDAVRAMMPQNFEDGEMDEDEDDYLEEYDEDIVYEPEGDDEDDVDLFDTGASRMGARGPNIGFVPFLDSTTRRGHHHHHHHVHQISSQRFNFDAHLPSNNPRARQNDGSNPLLQPQPSNMNHLSRPEMPGPGPGAVIGSFEQFIDGTRPFPSANDAPHQQMSFINNIMQLITHGGGTHMLPSHNGHAVRVHINSHDGSMLVRHRNGGRHSVMQSPPAARDDPLSASHFTVTVTTGRWQEEARILFGALVAEKAGHLVNALHQLLVPAAREAQKEEAAKQKRLEEEKKERERKDREERETKEKQEREEAEEKAREQRAAEEAAAAAALVEAARQTDASHDVDDHTADIIAEATAASDEDRMSGIETTPGDNLEVEEVPADGPREPVMRMLGGNQVDIAALGIDPDFFDALPPDMQEETFMMQVVTQRAEAEVSGAEATDFDAEFLAALPPEMREEILQTARQERRRRDREADRRRAAASAPGGAAQAEEMDIPNFLASLENGELRRSILMDADEDVLRQLPADLVAEARQYSRLHGNRPFRTEFTSVASHAYPPSGLTRHEPSNRPRRPQQFVQILDKSSVAILLRLLFLQQSGSLKGSFNEILSAVCQNKQNRAEVVSIILSVLQDTGNDISMDKTLAHLLTRAKAAPASKPSSAKKGATDIVQHTDLSPAMVAKNCLDTLSQLTLNQKVVEFFLTEHETNAAFKPKTPRKGKAKESRASRYPINALLGLLDKRLVTENAALTENLAVLLQALASPLSALAKKKQEEEQAAKALSSESKVGEAAPEHQAADITTHDTQAAVTTTDGPENPSDASASNEHAATATGAATETKKPRGITEAPEITDHNLRLVINIIAARECSSRAFQKTLTLMTHLASSVQNAMNIFGQELTRQAQELGRSILKDLRDLLKQIRDAKSGHEVHGVAIAKFSPASSDQTKLLRVIKALGYIFDPTRTFATALKTADNEKFLQRLYENDTFGPLWETLSSCLAAIHERGNMMNVATILLPLIEVLMVVCQNQTPQEVLATPGLQSSLKESFLSGTAPDASNNMSYMFLKFTDDHKKILNELVRSNPKLMSGSFSVLVKNSKVLEFDNKRNYFQRKLHTKEHQNGQRPSHPSLHVNVRRESTFLDSFRSLSFKKPDEFKYGKLNVRFQGEEGVDAGGLTREWFQVLVQQIFNPNYALFNPMASDRLTYHPNPLSSINDVHLSYFQFVGRVIGKAMYESRPLDCHFSRAVYKRMLGLHVGVKDMEAHDPSYYASLKYILENRLEDGMIGEFTFAAETEEFGEIKIEDLVPNGRNVPVTDDNKREYVRLIVEHKLVTSVKDQLDSFLKGFHDIIPADIISIFTEQELELLISGLPDIDVDDWKNNTEYSGYTASSPQIVWFWRMVRSFDKEQRAKLLQFVTGTSKVPLNGFKELEGMNGFSRFSIHRDYTSDRLPSAHTCFNQLDLPEYDSYEKLRDTLLLAITDGSGEFGFA